MGKMPDGKVMYTLDGRPVTEEPEGSPEEKHYKRIINQVSGYVREVCQQMTQTVPKAIVHCMVLQVRDCVAAGTGERPCRAGGPALLLACLHVGLDCLRVGLLGAGAHAVLQQPADPPSFPPTPTAAPQSKDRLLEEMQASVAGDQEVALKRLLGEDESVMKRREALTHKLDMLQKAQAELTSVDV